LPRTVLFLLVVGMATLGAVLFVFANDGSKPNLPTPQGALSEPAAATATSTQEATAEPTAEQVPTQVTAAPQQATSSTQTFSGPIARLVIPKAGVNAPVAVLGLNSDNTMPNPKGYFEVAWYNFTEVPGTSGNAVFSGHVDCAACAPGGKPGAAIFYNLDKLTSSDEIQIELANGTKLTYRVTRIFTVGSGPSSEFSSAIVPNGRDTITLITCTGTFRAGEYDTRRIVQAERV